MRLEASVLKNHLRRGNPTLFVLTRFIEPEQREGLEALYILVEILNHSVASAGSRSEALGAVEDLERLFSRGVTHVPLFEQTSLDPVIEAHPNFGLAWEAWCSLEETFGLPRSIVLDFIEGLRFDCENRRPQNLEDLLRFAFLSGGVLGVAVRQILCVDAAFTQAAVDAFSSARLTTLSRTHRRDLELGRNRIPVGTDRGISFDPNLNASTAILTNTADVLFRSFDESLGNVSFKHQLLFMTLFVLHRNQDRNWLAKLDRVIDAALRVCGRQVLRAFRGSETRSAVRGSGQGAVRVDPGIALKNQSLRLSRDSDALTKNKRLNDHSQDTPNTFR